MTWKEYATSLIVLYEETELEMSQEDDDDYKLSPMMLECWKEAVMEKAKQTFMDYQGDLRLSPQFTEDEYMETFTTATEKLVGRHLEKMVDEELISMSVSEKGEIIYKTTDKGIQEIERLKKKMDDGE